MTDKNLNALFLYAGTIVEVIEPSELYEVKVDIPGVGLNLRAFPRRGEVDEPRVGDFVLLHALDPVYNSYFLYQRLKENEFIGFRSHGKMVDITKDYVQIATYDIEKYNNDHTLEAEEYRPEPQDWMKMDLEGNMHIFARKTSTINIATDPPAINEKEEPGDATTNLNIKGDVAINILNGDKDGNLTIKIEKDNKILISGNSEISIDGNSTVKIKGGSTVSIGGKSNITVKGDCKAEFKGAVDAKVSSTCNLKVSGSTKLDCPDVTITGGKVTMKGNATPDLNGPFTCVPNCLFNGAPHKGSMVTGT